MRKFQISNFKFQIFCLPFTVHRSLITAVLLFTVHCSLFTVAYADDVSARSALIMDASNGRVLFAKNPDLKQPAASTIKIMTAIVVAENVDLDSVTTITSRAANQQPSKTNLKKGDRIKIRELLYAALMESANDAATALAEAAAGSELKFVKLMNQKALEIGAANTKYINANGLPGKGQYSTVSDLAKIMQYAIRIPVIKEILTTKVREISTEGGRKIFVRNTNRLLWADDDFQGGKTGFTRTARHCFVGASNKENKEIIISVLGAPSRPALWSQSEMLFGKGSRISNMQEEPVIYITSRDTNIKKIKSKLPPKAVSKGKGKKHKRHLVKTKGTKVAGEGKNQNI
ncbi:MAG: D-alanyl-D-alanine carboxypeptidase [Nitrospirae bacterium]|nr:D-alanyl-D-alanine carboxypeptidase [Nitrospirota bacterium]